MNKVQKGIQLYLIVDFITAIIGWLCFFVFRKSQETSFTDIANLQMLTLKDIINALLIIPLFWLAIHALSGAYFSIYRKSKLHEIYRTFISALLGCLVIFFVIVVNDKVNNYTYYQKAFFYYFIIHTVITSIGRHLVLRKAKKDIRMGDFSYRTLMIGGNSQGIKLYQEIKGNQAPLGNNFVGFVYADDNETNGLSSYLPKLGTLKNLEEIIKENKIEEAIIAIDTHEHHRLQDILTQLTVGGIVIKIQPDLYDLISGSVRTNNVMGAVMIEIYPQLMPDWQRVVKRVIDVSVSLFLLIFGAPFLLFAAIRVKLSSHGGIFYAQERVGLHGKPFKIFKFRSMVLDAEKHGPALSSDDDPRTTKWGKTMRKWRIDELPQFYNVLIGDMSLVGPRPERQYFIDKISETHAQYKYLHIVKPGLSSWGMVKYGYASNIQQMKERMKYDLLYIKNCSLALDTKIMFYTLLVILQGRGK